MELNANVTPSEKSLEQINPKPRKKNYTLKEFCHNPLTWYHLPIMWE